MHMQHPVHALPAWRTRRVCATGEGEGEGIRINFARAGMRDRPIVGRRHSIIETSRDPFPKRDLSDFFLDH